MRALARLGFADPVKLGIAAESGLESDGQQALVGMRLAQGEESLQAASIAVFAESQTQLLLEESAEVGRTEPACLGQFRKAGRFGILSAQLQRPCHGWMKPTRRPFAGPKKPRPPLKQRVGQCSVVQGRVVASLVGLSQQRLDLARLGL